MSETVLLQQVGTQLELQFDNAGVKPGELRTEKAAERLLLEDPAAEIQRQFHAGSCFVTPPPERTKQLLG
ncbi:MAG TPA: hypothetical protein VMG60_02080 [Burkholderiaceae bacterium]|nr:hypothetical protein [Burkholderiaceae bacterium]